MALGVVACLVSLTACDSPENTFVDLPNDDEGDTASNGDETGDEPVDETGSPDPTGATVMTKRCVDVIDSMDEGMTLIPATDGRQGAWFVFNDETEGGVQGPSCPFVPAAGGAPNSDGTVPETLGAARTSGSGYTEWGAGIGFNLKDAGCAEVDEACECVGEAATPTAYDATQYEGISYYARYYGEMTGVPVIFKVVTQGVVLEADGGTCVVAEGAQCEGAYQTSKPAFASGWTKYEIPFSSLTQPSYVGTNAIPFDPTTLWALQWQVNQNVAAFDFAIDEICFY